MTSEVSEAVSTSAMVIPMDPTFGSILKSWRERRRMSQMDLGLTADVSARHIAFLEKGRAQPSRAMVLRLCRHLEVPLADRNGWLLAAGYAGHYKVRPLGSAAMTPVRAAMERMLATHDPYPGFVLDRHWCIRQANASATRLLGAIGVGMGTSLLETFADRDRMIATFENADEIRAHFARRLKTESLHYGGDPILERAAQVMAEGLDLDEPTPPTATIAARLKAPGGVLSFFTVLAHFGSTEDIAVAELKIELMFPADDATQRWLTAQT
jgi:transcriptional regulator with XRE-family HTH domain